MPISILTGRLQFGFGVTKAFISRLNKEWPPKIRALEGDVQQAIREQLYISDTYRSLISGTLKGEFGLDSSAETITNQIVEIIATSTETRFLRMRLAFPKVHGGVKITLRSNILSELINSLGSYISTPSGQEINWLEWLLLRGDDIVIGDYHVVFKPFDNSRSGMALMFKNGAYKVHGDYSGTKRDNWITRTLRDDADFNFRISGLLLDRLF